MFCVFVVAAKPKTRIRLETTNSIPVTIMDFLFLLLKDPKTKKRYETIVVIQETSQQAGPPPSLDGTAHVLWLIGVTVLSYRCLSTPLGRTIQCIAMPVRIPDKQGELYKVVHLVFGQL